MSSNSLATCRKKEKNLILYIKNVGKEENLKQKKSKLSPFPKKKN